MDEEGKGGRRRGVSGEESHVKSDRAEKRAAKYFTFFGNSVIRIPRTRTDQCR